MYARKEKKGLAARSIFESLALGLAVPVLITPAFLIIMNADRLGPWTIPLLMAYILLFYAAIGYYSNKSHLDSLHYVIGDERFYDLYPLELKKVLLKKRRYPVSEEVVNTIEYYKAKIECNFVAEDEAGERRSRQRSALFYTTAAIIALIAVFCAYEMFRSAEKGSKMDFALCLRFVSTTMAFIVASFVARKKPQMILNGITAILLFLNIWADLADHFLYPDRVTFVPAIISLVVFALFMLAAFALVAAARRIRTRNEIRLTKGEFDLAMYELGVIDERELAFRFGEGNAYR